MSTLALWIAGALMGNLTAFKFALLLMELSKLDKDKDEDTD